MASSNDHSVCAAVFAGVIADTPLIVARQEVGDLIIEPCFNQGVVCQLLAGLCWLKPARTGKPKASSVNRNTCQLACPGCIDRFQQVSRVIIAIAEALLAIGFLIIGCQLQQPGWVPESVLPGAIETLAEAEGSCCEFSLGVVLHAKLHVEGALGIA